MTQRLVPMTRTSIPPLKQRTIKLHHLRLMTLMQGLNSGRMKTFGFQLVDQMACQCSRARGPSASQATADWPGQVQGGAVIWIL